MKKQLLDEILKIKSQGLTNIDLLGLITNTSYEVIFYAKYKGLIKQSNALAEEGILSLDFVDKIYNSIAKIVRDSEQFDPNKMNIVIIKDENITFKYDEKNCRSYNLKKNWKKSIDV